MTEGIPAFGTCIGEEVAQIIGVEAYWLTEVQIEPGFGRPPRKNWTEAAFNSALDRIQERYETILAEKGLQKDILFGLGRVCQHALYHYVRTKRMRMILQPGWTAPGPYKVGSWARAVDYMTALLSDDEHAEPMSD